MVRRRAVPVGPWSLALTWAAATASAVPRQQTWYMVDTPSVVCTGATPPAPGTVNITVPLEGIRAANLHNAPHVLTLFRTSKRAAQVTFQVVDARGRSVVAKNTISLRELSRRLGAVGVGEAQASGDEPRGLRGGHAGGHGGGRGGHSGFGGRSGGLAGSRSRPLSSPRRRAPGLASARRRAVAGAQQRSEGGAVSSIRRRGSTGPARLPASGVGGSRYQNAHGQSYGFTQPQAMNQYYPGGYTKTGYGYSGVNSYTPAASGSTGNVVMAAMGGAALGVGASYLYSRWNSYGSCYSGSSWTGSCSSCYAAHPASACQLGPPQVSAHRDDLMSTGFWPDDWASPLTVVVSGVGGPDFGNASLCAKATPASAAKGADLFFTLTKVEELSARPGQTELAWSRYGPAAPAIFMILASALCCCVPAWRARKKMDEEEQQRLTQEEPPRSGRGPVVLGAPADLGASDDDSPRAQGHAGPAGEGFMDTAAPSGVSWRLHCKAHPVEADPDTGLLTGAWGECLAWAKVYEARHPDWPEMPEYARDGPCGQVLEAVADAAGFDEVRMEEAAERLERACEAAIAAGSPLPVIDQIVAVD